MTYSLLKRWVVTLCILLCTKLVSAQVTQSEFDALKAFYNSTNGDAWTIRTGWENINTTATAADVNNSWEGLTVADNHVTQIVFSRNNLTGTIPTQIGNFNQLIRLSLPTNTLTGSIPSQIGNLVKLASLTLVGNNLSGNIPAEIGNLNKLTLLFLGSNELTGDVPASLQNLTLLTNLSLRNNQFTSVPKEIENLSQLTKLHLQDNLLTSIPKEIGNLANLTELILDNNKLANVPKELGKLAKLRRLELQDNLLTALPNFSSYAQFTPTLFWVQNNLLGFGEIIPNLRKISSYSPQGKPNITPNTVTINSGKTLNLRVNVSGGSHNKYQWFKGGSLSSVSEKSSSPVFTKANVSIEDAGDYFCKITNAQASRLTIESKPVAVTITDDVAPTLTSTFPSNGQSIAINLTSLQITFSEKVKKGSGNILLKNKYTDEVVQNINIGSSQVVAIGQNIILRIAPPAEGTYYVTMPQGIVTDLSDNKFAGIDNKTTWEFIIDKDQNPTITSLLPAHNSTNGNAASLNKLTITFSENVRKGSGGYIRVKNAVTGTTIKFIAVNSSSITIDNNKVTINLLSLLTNETTYYVTIPSTAFTDAVGNRFAGIANATTWKFSLGTAVAPTLTQVTPANNSTNIAINLASLKIAFSENIKKGTNGYVTIKNATTNESAIAIAINSSKISINDAQVIVALDKFLAPNTLYYVEIPEGTFTDVAGNSFAGITNKTNWQFTTGEASMPIVNSLSPANKSSISPSFNTLQMTFSKQVQRGMGVIYIKAQLDNRLLDQVFVTSGNVLIENNKVSIKFDASGLAPKTTYYVTVPASAFKDGDGNEFPGIDKGQWVFTTEVVSGLNTLLKGSLKILPNPSPHKFYIEIKNNPANRITYKVMNSQSSLVKQGTLTLGVFRPSIDLSNLPQGVYLIYFTIGKETLVRRVVKI